MPWKTTKRSNPSPIISHNICFRRHISDGFLWQGAWIRISLKYQSHRSRWIKIVGWRSDASYVEMFLKFSLTSLTYKSSDHHPIIRTYWLWWMRSNETAGNLDPSKNHGLKFREINVLKSTLFYEIFNHLISLKIKFKNFFFLLAGLVRVITCKIVCTSLIVAKHLKICIILNSIGWELYWIIVFTHVLHDTLGR